MSKIDEYRVDADWVFMRAADRAALDTRIKDLEAKLGLEAATISALVSDAGIYIKTNEEMQARLAVMAGWKTRAEVAERALLAEREKSAVYLAANVAHQRKTAACAHTDNAYIPANAPPMQTSELRIETKLRETQALLNTVAREKHEAECRLLNFKERMRRHVQDIMEGIG